MLSRSYRDKPVGNTSYLYGKFPLHGVPVTVTENLYYIMFLLPLQRIAQFSPVTVTGMHHAPVTVTVTVTKSSAYRAAVTVTDTGS